MRIKTRTPAGRYIIFALIDGIACQIGKAANDFNRAIDRAARLPLQQAAYVVDRQVGNEVWPCVRGYTSSKPPVDEDHFIAQRRMSQRLDWA